MSIVMRVQVRDSPGPMVVPDPTLTVERVAPPGPVSVGVWSVTIGDYAAAELGEGSTVARLHFDGAPDDPHWKLDVIFAAGIEVAEGDRFACTEDSLLRDGVAVDAWVGVPPNTIHEPRGWYDETQAPMDH